MTNRDLISQEPVQVASAASTDIQPGHQTGQDTTRSAFRCNGIDLNPDLVGRVDAMESGSAYRDMTKPTHWVLANASLRSMVDSLVRDKRRLAYWQGLDCRHSSAELAEEMVGELDVRNATKPDTVWDSAKFVARFTVRCLTMALRLQDEINAIKRQLRRAQVE